MDMWLPFQMASIQSCFRSIFHSQLCHVFICWFGCGRCFCFPGDLSQDPNINFVHHLYSTFVILCYSQSYFFLYPFLFSGEKNWGRDENYFFSLFWSWLLQILYIYLFLGMTKCNNEIFLCALLMLPVKRVPYILLLLPFKTKYCMIPVSLSSLKPRITKHIFVRFTSCIFKSPSSCHFHVFSWLHLWSM